MEVKPVPGAGVYLATVNRAVVVLGRGDALGERARPNFSREAQEFDMKVLIAVASLVSIAAAGALPSTGEAASRSLGASMVGMAAANRTLVPAANEQTPATADEQKKKGGKKGGKKSPGAATPPAGAPPAAKTPATPPTGAAATGVGKKPSGTPAPGPAAAAGTVKKGPGAPPAPAAAATSALPPGVPAGATMVPATGGNPPSYIVPTPNGTQTYVLDPRTGQYSSPSAVTPQQGQ
jgi:hypothetical protein